MEDFKNKAENLADKVAGEAQQAYGKVTDSKTDEVAGAVKSGAADVKQGADNLADKAKDLFEDVKESVTGGGSLKDKFHNVVEDIKEHGENLDEIGDELKEKASELKDFAEDKLKDIKAKFDK